jgi:hypothetical protein
MNLNRYFAITGALMVGLLAQGADGKHIARAVLQARTGATVASAQADSSGHLRFTNVPPGDYKLVLTNADGRSVTVGDLDGDGQSDIVVQGASPSSGGGAGGAGKVNVQDLSFTKRQTQGASFGEKAAVVSPRDSASGQATGKRQHKPYACLVDWDGTIKGGFVSEAAAQAEGQKLPDNTSGRCAVKVLVEAQPGTIEVQSWSWGASKTHTKTGHVTLMK